MLTCFIRFLHVTVITLFSPPLLPLLSLQGHEPVRSEPVDPREWGEWCWQDRDDEAHHAVPGVHGRKGDRGKERGGASAGGEDPSLRGGPGEGEREGKKVGRGWVIKQVDSECMLV